MIVELKVENLAIIDQCQLTFGPGYTVLTGETGAGKSLMIDALELALGERADTELVRSGATKATVELVMDLSGDPRLISQCEEFGVPLSDGLLVIKREVFAEGRSSCRVNGSITPVGVLKKIGSLLVDLHGQHQHQSLLDPESHVGVLDQWIGDPIPALKADVENAYGRFAEIERKLVSLKRGVREQEQKLDLLRYQVQEIEAVNPVPGESEEIANTLARLKNVERLSTDVSEAMGALSEGEQNANDLLGVAQRQLMDAAKLDTSLLPTVNQLEEALAILSEVGREVSRYFDSLEADPNLLDEIIQRQDAVKRLKRKYGDTEEAILEFLQTAKTELDLLEGGEQNLESLTHDLELAKKELEARCAALTTVRKENAVRFTEDVRAQLADLAMDKARLEVGISAQEPSAAGADWVEFQFSANAGEPLKPLAKIASGGEISRVMLAAKCALAGKAGTPTLIFDEVDTGLGGRAAATMGRKLAELGRHYQVLVISHLPQVASQAVAHFKIQKDDTDGRVVTRVYPLSDEARVEEIARMLAGETLTDSAVANAKEMLRLL